MAKQVVKTITTGYVPRAGQALLHAMKKRFNVILCHRRWGKTHYAANEIIDCAFRNKLKNPQYGYLAPNYGQAKRVAWDIFKDYFKNIPGVEINEAELRIDIPRPQFRDRIRIILLGAENPGSLRGIYLDGVVLDEYAEMDPTVWSQVIRPALADRSGWAIFIGTPKGQNHFHDIYQHAQKHSDQWLSAVFKASESGVLSKEELESARREMPEEEYMQEFECSFTAALVGAFYGKYMELSEKEGRITDVPWDSALNVITYWDLGISDTTVIWFMQQFGMQHRAIDYYEMSGMGMEHYVKLLQEKPYSYHEHVLPHDAAARDLSTGRSREEHLRDLGMTRTRILERSSVEDGINACRMLLPKVWFDKTKCARGIHALKNYEQKWDAKNKIFSKAPLHNWASHAADGFRTFGMGVRETFGKLDPRNLPDTADNDYNIFGGN